MGGRGQPARHRLRVLVAGLAKVGVNVQEPGQDQEAARPDAPGIVALEPVHGLEDAAADDDLAGPLALRDRVHEPCPADLEEADGLADAQIRHS